MVLDQDLNIAFGYGVAYGRSFNIAFGFGWDLSLFSLHDMKLGWTRGRSMDTARYSPGSLFKACWGPTLTSSSYGLLIVCPLYFLGIQTEVTLWP